MKEKNRQDAATGAEAANYDFNSIIWQLIWPLSLSLAAIKRHYRRQLSSSL